MAKNCPKKSDGGSASFCSENRTGVVEEVEEVEGNFVPEIALQVGDCCDEKWWLDSACSQHMTGVKEDLSNYVEFEEGDKSHGITLADKSVVYAEGQGELNVYLFEKNGKKVPLTFKNVMFVPELKKRLISIGQLTKRGGKEKQRVSVTFTDDKVVLRVVQGNGERIFEFGNRFGKLYELTCEIPTPSCNYTSVNEKSLSIWHQRFGHLNHQDVLKLQSENMVEGLTISKSKVPDGEVCEGCVLGKQTRNPFPKKSSSKSNEVLERIHTDVCGPISVSSIGGSLYFITFIDDYSNHLWVYTMKKKSEALDKFIEFSAVNENLMGKNIKRIRSDNGGEYFSDDFNDLCRKRGIYREPTIPHTPQQNGVAERMNRTIMDNVRALLYHSKLPLHLWAEALSTVVYLRNRSPTSSLKGMTPYERVFNAKPDVRHLRIFGCTAYAKIPEDQRKKLDPKAVKGIFVGYPVGSKGYKIFLPEKRKIMRCRDVKFVETKSSSNEDQPPIGGSEDHVDCDQFDGGVGAVGVGVSGVGAVGAGVSGVAGGILASGSDRGIGACSLRNGDKEEYLNIRDSDSEEDGETDVDNDRFPPHRPQRRRRSPNRYGEWAAVAVTNTSTTISEPKTYKQAIRSSESESWKKAMSDEYNSLTTHGTWDLVDLPEGKNLVGSKWVYKIKRDASGEIDRFKARCVAQGYSQEYGVDFDEVFAPVARYKSIRSLLAIANQFNLEVHQMDVVTAFLNGKLEEEIFMQQPEGFVDEQHPEKVCRLNSSLYGLKQSARCWNKMMDAYLKENGYVQSTADPCIYLKTEIINGETIIVLIGVYVDDTILCSNNQKYLKEEKKKMSKRFKMEDKGEISFILGMKISRDRVNNVLTISQKSYLQEVLERFGMQDCRPVATPVEAEKKFVRGTEEDEKCNVSTYQSAIGSLNYAAIATRPDLSLAVGMLSQFMQSPTQDQWTAVKRILRYVKGTLDFGLQFTKSEDFALHGFSDSDWAGCSASRKSTSGQVFRLGDSTISWRSKKQPVIALSSTEAEYVALCEAAQETTWLRRLLHDIGFEQKSPTMVYEDNQGCIALGRNPKDHPRTKHIDVKFHYVRDVIERKKMDVTYCPTGDMVADTLTKSLAKPKFEKFRRMMGVVSV